MESHDIWAHEAGELKDEPSDSFLMKLAELHELLDQVIRDEDSHYVNADLSSVSNAIDDVFRKYEGE